MDLVITGLAAPVALGSVALIGYLVSRHRRRVDAHHRLELSIKLDQAHALIERVEQLSNQLRRSMASHHWTVTSCKEQFQILSDRHSTDTDPAHHMHLQDVLGPTQQLSDDIAHAYDELRRHTCALRSLRHR